MKRVVGRRELEPGEAKHLFVLDPQWRLAGHQHAQAGRSVEHRSRQPRDADNQVLGVVQHQQGRYRRQRGKEARQLIPALSYRQSERSRNRGNEHIRVRQLRQVDPGCQRGRPGGMPSRSGHRQGGLANASGADDSDEPMPRQQLVHGREFGLATE